MNAKYVIRAHYTANGNVIDCSQAEVLGQAFGAQYATREAAEDIAESLQDDVTDVGLDPTTTYTVEQW